MELWLSSTLVYSPAQSAFWWRRSGVFIVNIGTDFTHCFSVFIVDFEQVNADWDMSVSESKKQE